MPEPLPPRHVLEFQDADGSLDETNMADQVYGASEELPAVDDVLVSRHGDIVSASVIFEKEASSKDRATVIMRVREIGENNRFQFLSVTHLRG